MTGSGTVGDPYIIEDVDDLQAMENDLAAYYELGGNIDASATTGWNSGAGFAPITAFTGSLDGKGYKVSALFIDRTFGAAGLFYNNAGSISNLGLVDCDFTDLGGSSLVGYINTGTITKCYSTGAIKETGAGGLGGGFVTINEGTITNCYTRCSVDGGGAGSLGGFVYSNDGTIEDCYSTGAVSNGTFEGGFCQTNADTITNCFWDTETSGQASSDGGTGKTTAQMKTESTFTDAGWDFSTPIWYISGTVNDGYPALAVGFPYSQAHLIS